jgi:hypothetical protein
MRSTRLARALALLVTTLAVAASPLIAAEAVGVLAQINGDRILVRTKGANVNVRLTPGTQFFVGGRQIPKKAVPALLKNAKPGVFLKVTHDRGVASKIQLKKGF